VHPFGLACGDPRACDTGSLRNIDVAQRRAYALVVNLFEGLADPTRLRVLELLAEHEELPAGRIADNFRMTRAGVSRHLRTLEEAGFVIVRVDAQRRLYRLNPEPFAEIDVWLGRYRRIWGAKFASLRRHLEEARDR
jgi:DNA-binding transcriptional ArsR family regulator